MEYRIEHISDTSHATQHAVGEALVKDMLAKALDCDPTSLVFCKAEGGKPYIEGIPLHFNVSHSFDTVLCAIHTTPIGVDIQKVLPIREKVIKRICTPAEIAYIGDDPIRFMQVWTRKEAYAKFTGKGLSFGLSNVPVAFENGLLPQVMGCSVLTQAEGDFVFSIIWDESALKL